MGQGFGGENNPLITCPLTKEKTTIKMNKLLREILEVQSVSENQDAMIHFIQRKYPNCEVDDMGNIFITKGEAETYPCVVAHLDTVHDIIPSYEYKVMELEDKVFAMNSNTLEFTGVGGDDKCGIYVALRALEQFDYIKVAFFVDEELGCIGSSACDLAFFSDTGYIIQCDRQGYEDVVTDIYGVQIASDDFQGEIAEILPPFNKKFQTNGGLTDVYTLTTRGVGVSMLNLSCGYYRPHQPDEYIQLSELESTANFVFQIIHKLGGLTFPLTTPLDADYSEDYSVSYYTEADDEFLDTWGDTYHSELEMYYGDILDEVRANYQDGVVAASQLPRYSTEDLINLMQ